MTTSLILTFIVPAIVNIVSLPNNKISIQTNTAVALNASVKNCNGPTDGLSVNVVCDLAPNAPVTVVTVE